MLEISADATQFTVRIVDEPLNGRFAFIFASMCFSSAVSPTLFPSFCVLSIFARLVFSIRSEEIQWIRERLSADPRIPQNFVATLPFHDPAQRQRQIQHQQPSTYDCRCNLHW